MSPSSEELSTPISSHMCPGYNVKNEVFYIFYFLSSSPFSVIASYKNLAILFFLLLVLYSLKEPAHAGLAKNKLV